MSDFKHNAFALLACLILLTAIACQQPGTNKTGSEYMPDMAHSIAYEANVFNYYRLNTWDSASVVKLKDMSNPRLPVAGTIPRGYAGLSMAPDAASEQALMDVLRGEAPGSISVPLNGHVPFYYGDSEDERTRAIAEIIDNPYPITTAGLDRAEPLYNSLCGICHGEKGDGAGYLVRDDGGLYPAAPANFLLDEHLNASNGRYYYAIMYGKNVMGAYADKISYEERWQVIHYIRSLQAKAQGAEYSENANTLNPEFGVPGASLPQLAAAVEEEAPAEVEAEQHSDSDQGNGEH